jgi:uncharacterized membrane protein
MISEDIQHAGIASEEMGRVAPGQPKPSGTSKINVGNTERILSLAGGAFLTFLGTRRFTTGHTLLALTGGALLYRGASGNCPVNSAIGRNSAQQESQAIELTRVITVRKPRQEVYAFWRQLENLPRFMHHLKEVKQLDNKRSHWEANIPGKLGTIAWDAEITHEEENTLLAWQSVPGATVDNAGEVQFKDAPADRGTEMRVHITYNPPAGAIGSTLSSWLNPVFKNLVLTDLRRFKMLMETGDVPARNQ